MHDRGFTLIEVFAALALLAASALSVAQLIVVDDSLRAGGPPADRNDCAGGFAPGGTPLTGMGIRSGRKYGD